MKIIRSRSDKIKGFFISATDTGVGKTLIAAALIHLFKSKGMDVGVMKPFQTGVTDPSDPASDARILKQAGKIEDPIEEISPYIFPYPLAPLPAAEKSNIPIDPARVKNIFRELQARHEIMIVEGIGGILVPITKDYFLSHLIRDLKLPLLIVSANRLGTLNQTLLTINEAKSKNIPIAGIIFNDYDDSTQKDDPSRASNIELISRLTKVPILGTIPFLEGNDLDSKISRAATAINLDKLNREKPKVTPWEAWDKKYLWHPFTQMQEWVKEKPIIIESGQGSIIRDIQGKDYLDGMASYWVNTHGHQNPEINQALREQLEKIAHSTLLGLSNTAPIRLARDLIKIAPPGLTRVFYSDNGSTAVEVALKMAFQYWQQKSVKDKKKTKFVYLNNSYHGDTLGAVGVGGIELFHKLYKPLLYRAIKIPSPYCYHCELGQTYPDCRLFCIEKIEKIIRSKKEEIAALIIEPMVQGPGGIIVSPPGFLKRVREICSSHRILFIADEVATGFGRTGKMFACEHEKIAPDILCLSKGITGGYLPFAATLVREEIYQAFLGRYEKFKTFFHGHTYTGNALTCAAAIKNIELFFRDNFLKKLSEKIKFLAGELENIKNLSNVGEVRQAGFFIGIELIKDKKKKAPFALTDRMGAKVCRKALEKGLIIRPLGNVVVLAPPLCAEKEELKAMTDIIHEAIRLSAER